MKVTACICVYNENSLLKACLKQFPEWVSEILVLVSETPWNGDRSPDEGLTLDVLRNCRDQRMRWFRMHWKNEHDQRNWGLGNLAESDWVITIDADEYLTKDGWEVLRKSLEEWDQTDVVVAPMITYWKTPEWRWSPPDLHKPTFAVRPKKTAFSDKREVTSKMHRILNTDIHHFSWVRSDAEVWQKIQNYMHANDFDREKWYNIIWKSWTPEMKGLRPYGDNPDLHAIHSPAPQDILELFRG